tara:strand:+ start:644 stop:1561 length:918 start_codon:yes stop_codon:yes gene_type:complete
MPEQDQDLVVDIPTEGPSVSVTLENSPSQEIKDAKETQEPVDSGSGDDEEHEDYSKKVRRRIDRLTKKAREAERQQEAAISYARTVQDENQNLRTRVQDLDAGYVAEYGDRVATQSSSIERDLETAIATNDTAAQVSLNRKLSQLAIEEERVRAAKQQISAQAQVAQQQVQQQDPQQQQVNQQQVPVRPDAKAEKWASNNAWFGEDDAMTFAAFGIHKTLIEDEGFDTQNPEYYTEIDKRIREAFPNKFEGSSDSGNGGRRPQQSVASATRTGSSGRKTVRLTPSEVAIAQKLGVPLDQYAKHKR